MSYKHGHELLSLDSGKSLGRFTGHTPKQAVCKAFVKMLNDKRKNGLPTDHAVVMITRDCDTSDNQSIPDQDPKPENDLNLSIVDHQDTKKLDIEV